MTKARSARGVIIDFDLLKIKQNLGAKPRTVEVKAREEFIDKRLRRRLRKGKLELPTAEASVRVESPELAGAAPTPANELIDKPVETKQKLRPQKT